MKYGIVIFPSRRVQDSANNLRKRYDSHYSLIPPHITIKSAFEVDDLEEMIEHIESVTKELPPFSLKINRIRSFHPTTPVLYFAFEDNEEIFELYEQINSDFLKHEEKYKFTPHITIAQDIAPQEIHDIYSALSLKDYNMEFDVDRIHLLYQMENGAWTTYQTFLLRG